jgi:uncharacterized membrane protein
VFHTDIAKVDRDVANGCTHMLQASTPMFHLFFRCMLQACLSRCCIYLTHILQLFCLDVAHVCNGFQVFFRGFHKCFRHMFQVFHLPSDICCKCCIAS